jgi:penicillin-binding protein 1A
VIETAQRFGIGSTRLQPNLSTAIGSSDVKMIEHAEGYGVFATEGLKHPPVAILKVLTGDGKDITIAAEGAQRVIDPAPAYIIDNVLQGYTAFWHLGIDQWHMAAKSGTSSVQSGRTRDAWMMAYNPDLLVATWAGRTSSNPTADQSTYSLFGTSVGQSITTPFLKAAFSDAKWKHNFQQPPGVIQASCDPNAGGPAGTTAPAGAELLVSGDNGSGCAPPTPTPSAEPSATPNESPSPGGAPPPSPIITFPGSSPKPSPSPSSRLP